MGGSLEKVWSKDEVSARVLHLEEHYDEVQPEDLEAIGAFFPYLNNFAHHVEDALKEPILDESQRGSGFKKLIREAVERSGINIEEYRQFSALSTQANIESYTAKGKAVKKAIKKAWSLSLQQDKMVLPVYKTLRAMGFTKKDLCT